MEWEIIIGLEVHTQLATRTKLFEGSSTAYGAQPNTQAGIISLAMPGALPVLNKKAIEMAVKLGLSIDATINHKSVFERKNYFYPDLPKGYQISQYQIPIVAKGHLDILLEDGTQKRIGITRAHLEEDAGKSLHEDFHGMTGVDLNRAGIPLLEIVSEPEMRSAKEAVTYLKALHSLVRYLGVSDGNMQEGSFRCDANVSLRPMGSDKFGTRTEIKNINSFRFVERAIIFEVERQREILENGGHIVQETRLYDSVRDETRSMRSKEEAFDYRYFPDPDLLPVVIDEAFVAEVASTLPELPAQKQTRFQQEYKLSAYDAAVISASRELAEYFEQVVELSHVEPKLAANWITGDLAAQLNKAGLDIMASPVSAAQLAGLLQRIADNTISGKMAKMVFEAMWAGFGEADAIIAAKGLKQVSDSGTLEKIIDDILVANPQQLADYRAGKDKLFGFFVGLVMKATKGQANPGYVNELLKKKLGSQ